MAGSTKFRLLFQPSAVPVSKVRLAACPLCAGTPFGFVCLFAGQYPLIQVANNDCNNKSWCCTRVRVFEPDGTVLEYQLSFKMATALALGPMARKLGVLEQYAGPTTFCFSYC